MSNDPAQLVRQSGAGISINDASGTVNVKQRRWSIKVGRFTLRFGTGGAVSVLAALGVIGGGSAVVIADTANQVDPLVAAAAGDWQLTEPVPIAGGSLDAARVVIEEDGTYVATVTLTDPDGVSFSLAPCDGDVSNSAGDLLFTPTDRAEHNGFSCAVFTATPGDGSELTVITADATFTLQRV
jgi:hypothetical protein